MDSAIKLRESGDDSSDSSAGTDVWRIGRSLQNSPLDSGMPDYHAVNRLSGTVVEVVVGAER